MKYQIWNKIDKINDIDAEKVIKDLKIKQNEDVILIFNKLDEVYIIAKVNTIIINYDLDINLTPQEVAEKYIEILKKQKEQQEEEIITLEEQAKKISILEAENADLLLDSAIKDSKIQTLENDLADLTLEIAMMEVR